jgi:hypothetical protein
MGSLYIVTSPSGKSYVGITARTTEARWQEHVSAKSRPHVTDCLRSAIKKYGADAFTVRTLLIADSWEYLGEMEQRAIARYGTLAPHGYNLSTGGNTPRMADESKPYHSARTSEGTKRAWADGKMAGRAVTFADPEYKKRMAKTTSEAMRRTFADPEKKARLVESHQTPEYRASVSSSMRERWAEPEYRAAQVAKFRQRPPQSEESKRLRSEAAKRVIAERKANGTYWNERGTKRGKRS